MARESIDPKSGGFGSDLLTSVDLVKRSHEAVRELLLALEALTPPVGSPSVAFDALRGKAQAARRRLEDVNVELDSIKEALGSRTAQNGSNGGAPHVHVHVHLELPPGVRPA
jgi:hypothetical protein